MAITEAGKEALWYARLLESLGHQNLNVPIDLQTDNKGAIDLTVNLEFHRQTKHIAVQ